MPLPLLFIGVAVATGAVGSEKTIRAAVDNSKAKRINDIANTSIEGARAELDRQRTETGTSIEQLGALKLNVLDHDVLDFVTTFEQIKNIDFQSSIGLDELKDLHVDQNTFKELKELGNFALEVAGGASAGAERAGGEREDIAHLLQGVLFRRETAESHGEEDSEGRP